MPAVLSSASATPSEAPPAAVSAGRADQGDGADEFAGDPGRGREILPHLHQAYLDRYDFEGLVRALRPKAENPSSAPGMKRLLRGAEQLVALKEWLDLSLRHYTRQRPLLVRDLEGKGHSTLGVFLGGDGRVTFVTDGNPQPHDWAELQPALVGAIVVSALQDTKHSSHGLVQGAHVFARIYTLPAMTAALPRIGR